MAVGSTSSGVDGPIQRVCDSLYAVHRQQSTPTVQILFFHGLPSGNLSDAHLSTWKTENGFRLWEWLAEDFPGAHIYTVSYHVWTESCDMYQIRENLTSDLMSADIGQFPYRPVILVGHCVGGLVIREVCSKAYDRLHSSKESATDLKQLTNFLKNLRGIFDYSTPHRGSSRLTNASDGPLFKYFETLHTGAARLNHEFDDLCGTYKKWRIYGLGESLPTKSAEGVYKSLGDVEVPEASSRGGDKYRVVAADHISICQPRSKIDTRFSHLKKLINYTMTESAKEEEAAMEEAPHLLEADPENFQHLPLELTGVEEQVQEIIGKLDDARILCLTGMGGAGKTTLAMVVFNKLCSQFEFTCFIHNIKQITGSEDDAKRAILERLHKDGKEVRGQYSLPGLKGKQVLFVLDDISNRENRVISHLANVVGLESRFVVTCRQDNLLKISNGVHKVDFLNEDSSKLLFMKCVFPEKEVPPAELKGLFGAIVKKCDGLPLTLEIIGKYLQNDQSCELWKQTLNALENAEDVSDLNEQLWAKLRLSYDGLGRVEQQMFLDATTFFSDSSVTLNGTIRLTLGMAKLAWRAAYNTCTSTCNEDLHWKTLVDRCLVYGVEEDEDIKVHEQLLSLGRKIALEGTIIRVRDGKAGVKMLQNSTIELDGKEIHALRLESDESRCDSDWWDRAWRRDVKAIHISRAALEKLKKLHFLDARVPVIIDGATDGAATDGALFPTRLVVLSCVGHHSLFDPARQTQLAFLKLSGLDYLPDSIAQLSRLNHLEIRGCGNLCLAADFFKKLSSLRLLTLESCHGFRSLPSSVKHSLALKRLEFSHCKDLLTLPESFGQLSSLSHLKFLCCPAFHTLPESFGQLFSLRSLKFCGCEKLCAMPETFGHLSSLSYLRFSCCDAFHTLPESFRQLSSLSQLSFLHCPALRTLPKSFGDLSSLARLRFSACKALRTLPESFVKLSSLSDLFFRNCEARHTLPRRFGQLVELPVFDNSRESRWGRQGDESPYPEPWSFF